VLSSRDYTIDRGDDVRTACAAVSVTRLTADRFRVRLRCRGGIDDTKRLFEPGGFSYTVAYRITGETQTELAVRGYPFPHRDQLRPRPW
jgi:hypothetical protein